MLGMLSSKGSKSLCEVRVSPAGWPSLWALLDFVSYGPRGLTAAPLAQRSGDGDLLLEAKEQVQQGL